MDIEAEWKKTEAKSQERQSELDKLGKTIAHITTVSWFSVGLGFVIAVAGFFPIFFFSNTTLNLFGDFLGGTVASLWSLSGLLFIYVAFLGQKQQLIIQQIELSYTRLEMRATRDELKGQREELEDQNRLTRSSQFEDRFFRMLTILNDIVKSIDIRAFGDKSKVLSVGRECFVSFCRSLKQSLAEVHKTQDEGRNSLSEGYLNFYSKYENDLGHYFRFLYHIVKYVHTSDVTEKNQYMGILRAQLSSYELVLLTYNCISDLGYEKFAPLVKRYDLLQNLSKDNLVSEDHIAYIDDIILT